MRDRFKFVFPEREMRGREGSAFGGGRAYIMPYDIFCPCCGHTEFNNDGSVKRNDGTHDTDAAGPFREFSGNVTKLYDDVTHAPYAPAREHRSTEHMHPLRTDVAPSFHFRPLSGGTLTIILPHCRSRHAEDIISGIPKIFGTIPEKHQKPQKPKYRKNRSDML